MKILNTMVNHLVNVMLNLKLNQQSLTNHLSLANHQVNCSYNVFGHMVCLNFKHK